METGLSQRLPLIDKGRCGELETAIYLTLAPWRGLLPRDALAPRQVEALGQRRWDLLALTPEGAPVTGTVVCRLLLAPGDWGPLGGIQAERVVTYGLSPRDSLTLSSLTEPVLCVQRHLPRPDGAVIEPQEFPLPSLPGPPEELLPLLGLRLLLMPLAEPPFLW